MKKAAVYFAVFALLISCSPNDWEDTVITNDSGFEVTFRFSNTGEITLAPGEQKAFSTNAYQRLESYSPEKRVYFVDPSYKDDRYTGQFNDRDSWAVEVLNGLDVAATLSADDWMDEIEVMAGETDDTGTIYTDKPDFAVKTENKFPAVAAYNRDEDTKTFYVTIQRSR